MNSIPFEPAQYARLDRKTYGRIFVMDPTKVDEVIAIAREVDSDEMSSFYYPEGFIAAWPTDGAPRLIYGHKFEINAEALTLACWTRGIAIWCVTGHRSPLLG